MAFAQCYDFKLADADPATPGVQPECTMSWSTGVLQPSGALTYQDGPVLPACAPGAVQGGVPENCWRFSSDLDLCPTYGQRLEVLRTSEEIAASKRPPPGTKIHARCRTCADATAAGCG
jgi:hypothetical protein